MVLINVIWILVNTVVESLAIVLQFLMSHRKYQCDNRTHKLKKLAGGRTLKGNLKYYNTSEIINK